MRGVFSHSIVLTVYYSLWEASYVVVWKRIASPFAVGRLELPLALRLQVGKQMPMARSFDGPSGKLIFTRLVLSHSETEPCERRSLLCSQMAPDSVFGRAPTTISWPWSQSTATSPARTLGR